MFGRRKKSGSAEDAADEVREAEQVADEPEGSDGAAKGTRRMNLPCGPRPDGPWDSTEVTQPGEGRVDLGGIFVPGVEGMELRVEVAGDAIVAATVVLRDSAVQLQAFAAPKKEGIWGEVRDEIASGITQQGGIIDEVEGPLGWELRAQVPVQLPDGTGGVQLVRFVGVDGPRWFLRGVISGQGAVQPEAAGLLETIFRDTVVVRGDGPMAPATRSSSSSPTTPRWCPRACSRRSRRARSSPAAWASSSAAPRSPRSASGVGTTPRRLAALRSTGRWAAPFPRVRPTGHCPAVSRPLILGGRRRRPRTYDGGAA